MQKGGEKEIKKHKKDIKIEHYDLTPIGIALYPKKAENLSRRARATNHKRQTNGSLQLHGF